jgi:hypothetical protein
MKKALISPDETVRYVSGWTDKTPPEPIYTTIPNAQRVAEVADTTFEVALPLFWTDCADNVVADQWYYDSETAELVVMPEPAPRPVPTP